MADVVQIPKIQCDGCGVIIDKAEKKTYLQGKPKEYERPNDWGACRIDGSRNVDEYGNREKLYLLDLCPGCATAALYGAAKAIRERKMENEKDRSI